VRRAEAPPCQYRLTWQQGNCMWERELGWPEAGRWGRSVAATEKEDEKGGGGLG